MSKIKVKNFGPIKEGFNENDGFLDIRKITVFIGNQGSGKSTVAKLISTCKWLEKAMNRGDIEKNLSRNTFKRCFNYQHIKDFFFADTELQFNGISLSIFYNLLIEERGPITKLLLDAKYNRPKLMYVPSERNFLSIIKNAFDVTGLPYPLFSFAEEFKKAQVDLHGEQLDLPINNYQYSYDEFLDLSLVKGDDHQVNLLQASSGLQSLIPLYLVSRNLSSLVQAEDDTSLQNVSVNQKIRMSNEVAEVVISASLSESEKRVKIDEIRSKYHNSCFINIVEEPEQNLFPESQRHILNSLLSFANKQEANELLMTTHSPYIINYLSLAIQGKHLLDKINTSSKKEELLKRLNEIVPIEACVAAEDVAIYQFQNDGTICRLGSYEGIPSDKNYLNQSLAEGNHFFDALLELEEEL